MIVGMLAAFFITGFKLKEIQDLSWQGKHLLYIFWLCAVMFLMSGGVLVLQAFSIGK